MNIKSARSAQEFVKAHTFDTLSRITSAQVPGHNNKTYDVLLNRNSRGEVVGTCKCQNEDCLGNKNSICYHVLATLIASANRRKPKIKLSFCETLENAKTLVNIAGRKFTLKSKQSGKQIWVVAVQDVEPDQLLC